MLTFSEVARQCTELAGLKYYDEYASRSDGRFPQYEDAVTGCMEKSNFKRIDVRRIGSIRMRMTVDDKNGSQTFYVRKRRAGAQRTYVRYRSGELRVQADACMNKPGQDAIGALACLDAEGYEVTRVDDIPKRQLLKRFKPRQSIPDVKPVERRGS